MKTIKSFKLDFKNQKETEKVRLHTNVTLNGNYIGYIIKEPKEWVFVNDSNIKELTDTSKGYNKSLTGITKQSLINQIKSIILKLKL